MLITSCSCCGKCGCQCGKLPYTMTVGFSSFKNKTHGNYCDLSISANFGSGAAAVATSPGGCNGATDALCGTKVTLSGGDCDTKTTYSASNRGPLTGVLLTESGSCYARLGRVAPTLAASASSGSGAAFTVNTAQKSDAGTGFHYWEVSGITVSGGTDYTNGEAVTIRHSPGDSIEGQATATLAATDGVPTGVTVVGKGRYFREDVDATPYVASVTVSPCGGGTGAKIDATIDSKVGSPDFGKMTGLTVSDGGTNYLAWGWINTCRSALSGKSLVVKASAPEKLTSLHAESCYGSGFCGEIVPTGKREAPCITLPGNGTGSLSASLSQETGDDGLPYWKVSSASASGGNSYANSSSAAITLDSRTTQEVAPAITLAASGGVLTGATITNAGKFYIQYDYDGSATGVKKVSLSSGGTGYAKIGRESPTITLSATGGTGATITPTLDSKKDDCGIDYWYIKSVAASGGSGYTNGQAIAIAVGTGGTTELAGSITLSTTNNESTKVNGIADGATVIDGGKYYKENKALSPYVANVTINIDQGAGSSGSGAVITPTIETNTGSGNFGKITKLAVTKEGSGYTLLGGSTDCNYTGLCGVGLSFRGLNKEPEVTLGDAVYRSADKVGDCNSLPAGAVVLHSTGEGSVSLTRNGAWNNHAVCPCDGPRNCTPSVSSQCQSSIPCPPCTQGCDECNRCGSGCGCAGGNCTDCRSGPCDNDGQCADGCVCTEGECGPSPCPGCTPPSKITLTFSGWENDPSARSCASNFSGNQSHPGQSATDCENKIIQLLSGVQIEMPFGNFTTVDNRFSGPGYFFWSGGGFFTGLGNLPDGSPGCCSTAPFGGINIEGRGLYAHAYRSCSGLVAIEIAAISPDAYPTGGPPSISQSTSFLSRISAFGSTIPAWPSFCSRTNRQKLSFPLSFVSGSTFGYPTLLLSYTVNFQ